jgi:8-oxo-dGTP pyrophosphatase MutT (NUDIX family)
VPDERRPEALRTKVFGERMIYGNPWVRLMLVDIGPPDGRRFEHHVVRLQTVALALVLDDQDRVLMLWRHRFITDEWGWELPDGIVSAEEDPAGTAAREVEEETGWRPGAMKARIASTRSRTEVKVPRRIARRVMIPKKISTRFSQEPEAGVKCSCTRGCLASHSRTVGCL